MADVKKAIEAGDPAGINRAMETLTSAQHKAAETLYRQQSSGPTGGGGAPRPDATAGSPPPPGPGDVIDAEVVDEEKK
jgi:hypothetical protein